MQFQRRIVYTGCCLDTLEAYARVIEVLADVTRNLMMVWAGPYFGKGASQSVGFNLINRVELWV